MDDVENHIKSRAHFYSDSIFIPAIIPRWEDADQYTS